MAVNRAAPKSLRTSPRFAVPQHVASRSFPTELVLLNLNTGQYHGIKGAGGRMFEVLELHGDFEEAARLLAAEFEQPLAIVTTDLRELCTGLLERGLLEVTPA